MILKDKVIIVTGAGRGIGAAIARVVGREGATVIVNYGSSREKAEAVAAEIIATGGKAEAMGADVRSEEAVQQMVDSVVAKYGRVDGVVNNSIAGTQVAPLSSATLDDYRNAFDFGCIAVINMVKAVRPAFNQQGGGRIVNIVTELWNKAPAQWTVYMSGKGAMVGISRSLACELGAENITVNMVAPGWMADEKVDTNSDSSKAYAASLPLKRQGSAEEIGNGCAFFLSEYAGFVTGTYLPVCGGNVTQVGV